MNRIMLGLVTVSLFFDTPSHAAPEVPDGFVDELIANGFSRPVGIAFLPDGRLLVVEQRSGNIRAIVDGEVITLCTVPDVNTQGIERGLLGIAVDPQWPLRPFVYVHYTHSGSDCIRISRYRVVGDLEYTDDGMLSIDFETRYDLLADIPDAEDFHNGGSLRFGPDGKLYVSLGEDGDRCGAQDSTSLRGVILRLDVSRLPNGSGGPASKGLLTPADNPFASRSDPNLRLIWALGLRNPFRIHIDPTSGDLFIADVGENTYEEINHAQSGGLDFGWPWFEGTVTFRTCGSGATSGFTEPIHTYDHSEGIVVIGGPLYRQTGGLRDFPIDYDGNYFFSDYNEGTLNRLTWNGSEWAIASAVKGQKTTAWGTGYESVADYAIAPDGSIWYCHQNHREVRRITYGGVASVDHQNADARSRKDGSVYDLQGRRIEPKPNEVQFKGDGKKRAIVR